METYNTSPERFPDDPPHETYLYALGAQEEVDEKMDPTDFELWAYIYAIESYRDHERHGAPYEGGYLEWPWVYKMALDCVEDALAAGRAEARAKARADRD
jgi:hypothetical protein